MQTNLSYQIYKFDILILSNLDSIELSPVLIIDSSKDFLAYFYLR